MIKPIPYVAILTSIIVVASADLNLKTIDQETKRKKNIRGGKMAKQYQDRVSSFS